MNLGGGTISASTAFGEVEIDYEAFARADSRDREWEFPADHGPHPEFLNEWWYFTGNLKAEDGRHFGYQFTVFRRALLPETAVSDSEWYSNQVYLAHFTVSDIANDTFYHDTRFSRGAAGLAGATVDPALRVWLEDWEITAVDPEASAFQVSAVMDGAAVELTLDPAKPIVLHGYNGFSQRDENEKDGSYYYSIPRLTANGTITLNGEAFTVSGTSWLDREFSTGSLSENAIGWNWFGLQLDDDRELMMGLIRLDDGTIGPYSGGTLVNADGSKVNLPPDAFTVTATGEWTSSFSGATYPAGWEVTVDAEFMGADEPLNLTITPLMADQELHSDPIYWEGAVQISGDLTGYGYVELTGYAGAVARRI